MVMLSSSFPDLLLKAIESTSVESALCSLRLQRERHLQQKKVIRYKQQVAALTEAADDDPTQTSPPDLDLLVDDEGDIRHSDLEKSTVYQTIEDCDSLLQFLNKRAAAAGRGIHQADTLKALLSQNNAGCQGVKVPKDDKMIIEELRLHNIALLNHIADLLKETEGRQARLEQYEQELNQFRLENYELKEKLQRLQQAARGRIPAREDSESDMEHSTELYPFPSGMNLDDLPILRLPPLEMPKFDFDSLKIASNKCSEDETPPPWDAPFVLHLVPAFLFIDFTLFLYKTSLGHFHPWIFSSFSKSSSCV